MKGFLQRLVAGVAQPQMKLHPLPEPMYVPRSHETVADVAAPAETLVNVVAPMPAPERRGGHVARRVDVRHAGREDEVVVREASAPVNAVTGYRPLVGSESHLEDARIEGDTRMDADSNADARATPAAPMTTQDPEPSASRDVDARGVGPIAAQYLPLVIERLTQGASVDASAAAGGTAPTAHSGVARGERATGRVARDPMRERPGRVTPDEIQIHIGRIEVIATPPPAPRVVPAQARKGLSLDEYLSRRDGGRG